MNTVTTGNQILAQDINQCVNALSGLNTPTQVGNAVTLPDAGVSGHMVTWGGSFLAMSCTSSGYVDIYDLASISGPQSIARINVAPGTLANPQPKGMALMSGDKYLVVSCAQGYVVYDVSNPAAPSNAIWFANFGGGVLSGNAVGYGRSIITIDGNNGTAHVGDFAVNYGTTTPGSGTSYLSNDAFMFSNKLVTLGGTFLTLTPIIPASTFGTRSPWTLNGSVNFVSGCALGNHHFVIFDAGNLTLYTIYAQDPSWLGANAFSMGGTTQVTPALCTSFGKYVAVACYGGSGGTGNTVQIWDASSPSNVVLAQTVSVGTGNLGPNGVCLVGGRYLAVTTANDNSLRVFDLSGGVDMLAGSFNSLSVGRLVVSGDVIVNGRLSVERSLDVNGSVLSVGGYSTQ